MSQDHAPATDGPSGTSIVAAGIEWDAVKVPRRLGLRALKLLEVTGPVAVDPGAVEPMLYFLVPPGSTAGCRFQHMVVLGRGAHVVLPPHERLAPPGPYWLIPPADGRQHTDAAALRQALITAWAARGTACSTADPTWTARG
ncbi:hypothetical protein [Streptomyces boninensis]|uniref:hypothetical protein n=1 Tax=Streptomyces boninensis TaxID=2039455 RepID=UPI003B21C09D